MKSELKRITGILAFFEIWTYPLTHAEIEYFIGTQISASILEQNFHSIPDGSRTYYSTSSQISELRARRNQAEQISHHLRAKARKYIRIIRHFPFIRAIALGNTAAMNVACDMSDIDLLIVTKQNRIWTARFVSTIFFQLIGLRASKTDTKGKFCLSFYIDESYNDFAQIKKNNDIYLAFWITTLQPFFGASFWNRLEDKNAPWIEQATGIKCDLSRNTTCHEPKWKSRSLLQKIGELCMRLFPESIFRKLLTQKAKKFTTPTSPHYAPDMIFGNHIQKLHNPDKRDEIQRQWSQNMEKFQREKV